jgi:hypothetical protein
MNSFYRSNCGRMVDRRKYVDVSLIKKLIHKRQKIETEMKHQIASTNMIFLCIISVGLLGLIIYYKYTHKQYMDQKEKEDEERRLAEEARLAAEAAERARQVEAQVHKMMVQVGGGGVNNVGNNNVRNTVVHKDDREEKVREVSRWIGGKDLEEDSGGQERSGKKKRVTSGGYKTIQSILNEGVDSK